MDHQFSIDGNLTDEELAALTAVLNHAMAEAAAAQAAAAEPVSGADRVAERSRQLGLRERPSRSAWRASARGRYVA
ncbi:acyl-CoA carboxylase subunit epsilon [Micrococcoides hystricis]|uniref:Acyl-CoA carboxylase subunit epsilon n=1 Tax=Micrococcoides hystricis TaxID=1572761 RepID=A0ABV6PAC9_9MICC